MSLRFTSLPRLDLRYRNSPITTQVTKARTPRHNPTIKLVLELGSLSPVTARKKKKKKKKKTRDKTSTLQYILTHILFNSAEVGFSKVSNQASRKARKKGRMERWKNERKDGRKEVEKEGTKERRKWVSTYLLDPPATPSSRITCRFWLFPTHTVTCHTSIWLSALIVNSLYRYNI